MDEKSALRVMLAARRAIAFAAEPNAGARLAANFPPSLLISDQTVVAGYMPFRTEIDVLPLMRAFVGQGGQSVLPRVESPSPPWGGVGVGGAVAQRLASELSANPQTPHPPTPSPPKGGRGEALQRRAKRLRAEPTKYEQKLWDLLRAKRPDQTHWRRQVVIGGYVYDFGCHGLGLLVEVDGGVHNLPDVQARDVLKAETAQAHGYRLIRLQNEEVLRIETAQYFDKYAKTKAPPPLWGGVGVGGLDTSDLSWKFSANPHTPPSPDPFPPQSLFGEGGRGEALTFHLCDPGNVGHFTPNKMGLLEPIPTRPTATPNILLVPLLGFDRRGNRIGYGKGYYDQAITTLRNQGDIIAIGVAFAQQEVPEIPTQPHDQRLDWIITQNEAYRFPS